MKKIIIAIAALIAMPVAAGAQESDSITVAVLDTGIAEVGALEGRVIGNYDLYDPEEPRAELRSSHGTMVANIIAERTDANVRFIGMRIEKNRCRGDICEVDEKAIRRAIRMAIDMDVDVIQASIYGRMRRETRDLFIEAANNGIAVVLAAGNHGGLALGGMILKEAPANVYIVSSLDQDGRPSEFSAHMNGRLRDQMIWRLGEDIPTVNRTGEPTLATGTSFAAPLYATEIILQR